MTTIVTIEQSEGVAKINEELFRGYLKESFEHLSNLEEAQAQFKAVVETVAETTGIKKSKVSKYFKERFDAKTKNTKELGELFTKLDDVLAN